MKSFLHTILLIVLIAGGSSNINAQCLDLVKTTGFNKLNTELYVPEGRFDALTLSEGDNLKVYKSFFRGKTYKIVVIGAENMPKLKFQVKTMQGNVIYDNSEDNSDNWEYTSDRNQNLMITVEIPSNSDSQIDTGCIAVLLGYKM
ncbi:MAG: hypothetical protein L3J35_13075 [Bacteroidales bacterium]|nr:hypothetical protein [Bacteroidales bacterium]